jgi:hypothetical protein
VVATFVTRSTIRCALRVNYFGVASTRGANRYNTPSLGSLSPESSPLWTQVIFSLIMAEARSKVWFFPSQKLFESYNAAPLNQNGRVALMDELTDWELPFKIKLGKNARKKIRRRQDAARQERFIFETIQQLS